MDQDKIALVEDSFALVKGLGDAVPTLFYARLFETAPQVRPLFTGDMTEQGRKLMAALTVAVANLRTPERLVPVLGEMGRRHRAYGVEDVHYAQVGAALLWTLQQGLGDHCTPACTDAWSGAYSLVAETMIAGAAQSPST